MVPGPPIYLNWGNTMSLAGRIIRNLRAAFRGEEVTPAPSTRIDKATESVPPGYDPQMGVYGYWGSPMWPPSYQAQQIIRLAGFGQPVMGRRRRGEDRVLKYTRELLVPVARDLEAYNPYTIGLLQTLDTFTLGKGYTYDVITKTDIPIPGDVAPLVPRWERWAQGYLDAWRRRERWWEREAELYRRSKVDGEFFLRYFVSNVEYEGVTRPRVTVRPMEPEYIRPPMGGEEWIDGVLVDLDDVETELAYYFWNGFDPGEEVDASEVYHLKNNVVRTVRRGISDFCQAAEIMAEAHKLIRNSVKAAAYRESIVYFTSYSNADATDVDNYIKNAADYTAGRWTQGTDDTTNVMVREGVGVEHLPDNQEVASAPTPTTLAPSLDALNAALLAVGRRYGFPLWLLSGDTSSNTVATSLAAESPMGRSIDREQSTYGEHLKAMLWHVMVLAATEDIAPYPLEALKYLDLKVTPHNAVPRDRNKETDRRKTLHEAGILDLETWAGEEGYEYSQVRQRLEAERAGRVLDTNTLPEEVRIGST